MKVTQQQVAQVAGVTRATVSYVLAGRDEELKISAPVARRVRMAARRLGYLPNHAARALASGRSHTLGLLLGTAPFWGLIAEGVESAAFEAGYDVLLISTRRDPPACGVNYLRDGRVDALIALGWTGASSLRLLQEAPLPPVVMQFGEPVDLPGVDLDPAPGLQEAVRHLAGLGHRRLLWIEPAGTGTGSDRAGIVVEAAREAGLRLDQRPIPMAPWLNAKPIDVQVEAWREALTRALTDPPPATGVLCWNDAMALGLYAWLCEKGLHVPADVSVAGFDDWLAAAALPPLSTVSFEFRQLGAEAALLAMRLAEGTLSAEEAKKTVVYVPSRFIPRHSTGPAKEEKG
jgi:LacI family transcriptional regulator